MIPSSRERRRRKADLLRRCRLCGYIPLDWAFFARRTPGKPESFEVVRCPKCGLGMTAPSLPDHKMAEWYPRSYYGSRNRRFHGALEILVRLFRRRRAAMIRTHSTPGPVLDVGCGRGMILSYLRELGYEPYGVEISEHAAWSARHNAEANVHVGNFVTAPFGPEMFHAVIFWHSLEHIRRPFQALRHAHAVLKKGGLLVVAVPNSESLQARLTGRNWFHLDIPRHYTHFGRGSLERALGKRGFRVIGSGRLSLEQDPYGWIQSLYNAVGFEFDFLYSWLRGEKKLKHVFRRPFTTAAILLTLPFVSAAALLLTAVEAFLDRSGTCEIYAVKK